MAELDVSKCDERCLNKGKHHRYLPSEIVQVNFYRIKVGKMGVNDCALPLTPKMLANFHLVFYSFSVTLSSGASSISNPLLCTLLFILLQLFPVVIFLLLLMGRKSGRRLPSEHQLFSAVTLAMF